MEFIPERILLLSENEIPGSLLNTITAIHVEKPKQNLLSIIKYRPQLILYEASQDDEHCRHICHELKSNPETSQVPLILIFPVDSSPLNENISPHPMVDAVIYENKNGVFSFIENLAQWLRQLETLNQNNNMFAQFFHESPIYIFIKEITAQSNRIIYTSDNLQELFTLPLTEIIGKNIGEYAAPEFARNMIESEWDALDTKEVTREEEKQNDRYYITIKFPMQYEPNSLIGGFTIDITEQKLIEEALRTSEEHFRSIVDNSDAGYFYIDAQGIIQDVNPAWVKMYKYDSEEEIIGHHFCEIQRIEDIAIANEFVNGIMQNNSRYLKGEFSRKCKDGSIGYHTFSARPVYKDNEPVGIEGFIIDTTEHRLAVEALRASEERYSLIDEASQDMIYSYDKNSRFTHANTYLCKQLQLSPEQIIGKTHEELGYPQELCEEWAALHRRVYETNATIMEETTSIMPDGTRKYFEVVLNPIHDGEGNIIGIAGTTRDIDERKRAEAKIREQMAELRRWHTITMGREDRILELKKEINQLMEESGKPPKYKSVGEGK